jgi:F-type H+-transporting ATPase subunit b
MADLFAQLGISWKLLIAQIVNFTILALVLTKFLYKPIIKNLDERKQRVAGDIAKSLELEAKLKEADVAKEKVLSEARLDSEKLLKETEKSATELKAVLTKDASEEVAKIRDEAKKQIASDKEKVMQELKKDLGGLVALSVEKAIGDVADKATQDKLVNEAVKNAK